MRRALVALAGSLLLAPLAAAQGWLDSARWYLQPPLQQFHALGDFNEDGHDDLVIFTFVAQGSNNKLVSFRVAFNDGSGEFPTLGPVVNVPVNANFFRPLNGDSGLRRMVDLTGDGHIDLLLLEELPTVSTDVALHAWPGLGNGDFGAAVSIGLTGFLDAIAVGQTDADPQYELAIVEEIDNSEHTRWYDWDGGEFNGSAEAFIFGGIASPTAARLVALDLDLDGDDDLVFGQMHGQNLRVMQTVGGTPVIGQLLTVGTNSGHSLYPFLVDLIGGGPQDLLVIEIAQGGSEFWFVPVLNQSGTLVQGTRQAFSGGSIFGINLETCDWDADGDMDVLAFGWQEAGGSTDALVAMFRNDGLDGFGTGPVAKADLRSTAANTTLGTADLDGDGHLDAIGPQSVQFGRSRFETTPTIVTDFFFGGRVALLADADGDGDVDQYLKEGSVRLNNGTGACPGIMFMPAPPPGLLSQAFVAVGDLTGDGLPDFLEQIFNPPIGVFQPPTFNSMRLVRDDGLGHFVDGGIANATIMQTSSRMTMLVFDFDDDGDNDVWANAPGWWENDGTGHFATQAPLGVPNIEACAAGDLDGDGDADIAALGWPDTIEILQHTVPAAYASSVVHDDPWSLDSDSVNLADHDLDGDLDLSVAHLAADTILLFANDGAAGFTQTAALSTDVVAGKDPTYSAHAFQDVDGDGITDLLAGAKAPNTGYPDKVGLFRGLPGGGYEPARWYVGAAMYGAADADGDGDLDLMGRSVVKSRLFDGPTDGIIRQYGTGTPALSEVAPVLGASGPLRPGSATASMRVSRAVGGKLALLLYSLGEAAVPGLPFADATLYVQQPFNTLLLVLDGPLGVHGKGSLNLGLTPVLPVVAGITVYHQLAVFGGAGNGKSTSNGLQLTYGF